jgi:hypothetical protein
MLTARNVWRAKRKCSRHLIIRTSAAFRKTNWAALEDETMRHFHHLWHIPQRRPHGERVVHHDGRGAPPHFGYLRAQAPALPTEVPPMLPLKQVAYIKASNAEAQTTSRAGAETRAIPEPRSR